jgi:hypothetical protein
MEPTFAIDPVPRNTIEYYSGFTSRHDGGDPATPNVVKPPSREDFIETVPRHRVERFFDI